MKSNYEILGVSENATKEEIDKAYEKLKTKYSRDRFMEGDAGNRAAKNLTDVENAYAELSELFKEDKKEEYSFSFEDVENAIKNGNLDEAQKLLDSSFDRNAEWHYLQSVLFYKKNWINESKKQLEICMELDSANTKYKDAYQKLCDNINKNYNFNNGNQNGAYQNQNYNRQMGGTDMGTCADCCTTWCCMQLLCNGCCR